MGRESRPTDEIDLEDQPSGPRLSWTGLAGPAALDRSVLLGPSINAPSPWASCERISFNGVSLASRTTLRIVRRAFLTRSPSPTSSIPRCRSRGAEVSTLSPNIRRPVDEGSSRFPPAMPTP